MGGEAGGLSLESWSLTISSPAHPAHDRQASQQRGLGLDPFWTVDIGSYLLVGVTSTLVALPIYEAEAAPEERAEWQSLRATHIQRIERTFRALKPDQKVLLFCHDPTALPYLYELGAVREKVRQIERTIIGHLHSPLLVKQSQWLSRIPQLNFGHTSRRISSALRQARLWGNFNILLCPAPFGVEFRKDGGYYTVELDESARRPAKFKFRHFGPDVRTVLAGRC